MDKPKTNLVKSKSSNSAITTKSEPRKNNKKSRSNAEFQPEYQPLSLKKRGVYVEKKPTQISINEQPDLSPEVISKKPTSPRPIPRPGRKRFLASVLTILSQSTTGTQYPDQEAKRADKSKSKLKRKKEEEIIPEDCGTTPTSSKKKPKYRSKVLNDNHNQFEQLVVLKSTKEMTRTPSNYSDKSLKEPETIKWADILPSTPLVKNSNLEHVNLPEDNKSPQDKAKENKASQLEKDPSTMVGEVPKKDEKKLYNFFVDLLETTFNVYNVKTEFNQGPVSSVASSRVALEMDESVAKKLNIQKIKEEETSDEKIEACPSKHIYCIRPDENEVWDNSPAPDHIQPRLMCTRRSRTVSRTASPTKSFKKKRKLMSDSFDYKKAKPVSLTNSLTIPSRKILLKKDRKKHLFNLLKEQLKMEEAEFEEPQNFFQALKIIARNKRRCQKSIHFNESIKKASEGDVHVCQFKRRRLLSASTKSGGKKSGYHPESEFMRSMRSFTHSSDITSSSKKKTITITETSELELDGSQHSLEVYGFDYESTHTRKKMPKYERTVLTPYHSAASICDQDYNLNEALLKYSDSGTSSNLGCKSLVATKHGLRSLSQILQ